MVRSWMSFDNLTCLCCLRPHQMEAVSLTHQVPLCVPPPSPWPSALGHQPRLLGKWLQTEQPQSVLPRASPGSSVTVRCLSQFSTVISPGGSGRADFSQGVPLSI